MLQTFAHDVALCLRLTGEEEGGLSGCSQQEAPGPTSSGGSLQRGRPARSNRGRHSRWGDEMLDWEEVRRRPRSRRASGEEGRTRWSVLGPGESQECSQSQAAHGLTEADGDEADETEALDTTWISGGWVGVQVERAGPNAELRGHLVWCRIASFGADTVGPDESMRARDEASRCLRIITQPAAPWPVNAGPSRGLRGASLIGYHVRLGGDSPGARRSGLIVSYDAAADKV